MSEILTFESRDEFNRKPIAEKLDRLISSELDIFPMVIDGSWGTGKTEFCKKTIELIKQNNPDKYHLIYVDAFKSDHTGEPLLALLGEIIRVCKPHEEKINKMGNVASFLLKKAAKGIISYTIRANVDDLAEELSEGIKNISEEIIDSSIATLLKEQSKSEEKVGSLKELLTEIANEKEIVFFIDELDRCRPDYSLDMLEVIKHIFDIKNIKIIVITNKSQLKSIITHRYGISQDSEVYLDKFFKFSLRLPNKIMRKYENQNNSTNYLLSMLQKQFTTSFEYTSIYDFLSSIINTSDISLRQVEYINNLVILHDALFETKLKDKNYIYIFSFLFCSVMYVVYPENMKEMLVNSMDVNQLEKKLGIKLIEPSIDRGYDLRELVFILSLGYCSPHSISTYKMNTSFIEEWKKHRLVRDLSWYYDFELANINQEFKLFRQIFEELSLCTFN